ncbi:MAG: B12-binding domain-containing radical SAM protein [Enhydrobacter sp.]|nr:B12-binding domain-containing radical SAM protein [Enhydrobacter sp.]
MDVLATSAVSLPTSVKRGSPNVLLVFPRFNQNSFWSLRASCDIYGVRCPAPPLGLITVAALLPPQWNLRLVDRNAEELAPADLAWADLVFTGGMLPQRPDCQEVIRICQAEGKPVVVGGPDATSSPELFAEADFLVLGEAEGIMDRFVQAWEDGERTGRFEAAKFKVDVARSPIPRFDLLRPGNYLYIGVQFSRGCPFMCEFCDIIELYGRVPRSKTNEQMLAELQALFDMGYRGHVDFVDDNFIGNKKNIKKFLPALEQWQVEHGHPFMFSTEASINVADDAELLAMMGRANFFAIFVGIESPDTNTLVVAQKKQNTRRSLADSVHRIYAAGMIVLAGFIVGFDTEESGVAPEMIDCIEATSIPVCMVGMLTALPGTQLTRRLEREGRLLPFQDTSSGDQCTAGLNFTTLRPRREILEDYRNVLLSVYRPAAFFERVRHVGSALRKPALRPNPNAPPEPRSILPRIAKRDLIALLKVMIRMTFIRTDLTVLFWRTLIGTARENPAALHAVVIQMVMFLHLGQFAKYVIREVEQQIDAIEREGTSKQSAQASPRSRVLVRESGVP